MAESHPDVQCTILDIRHLGPLPPLHQLPALPNVELIVVDAVNHFPFADNTFDLVDQHLGFLRIPADGWIDELRELLRITAPGGGLQLIECGFPERSGP